MATFVERVIGAAKLHVPTYEEVENDAGATGQALLVVVLSSLASAVAFRGEGGPGFLAALIGALAGWVIWAFMTYVIGTRILRTPDTHADLGQLLRTIGFAQAPGILRVFAFLPLLRWIVLAVTGIWIIAAFVIAVRQALDYKSTGRALLVCLLGFVFYIIVFGIFMRLLGAVVPMPEMQPGM
jgi:hypothetical protein